jgi:predicted cobalt transporter CbtA
VCRSDQVVLRSGDLTVLGNEAALERWLKSAVMACVTVVWMIYMLIAVGKYLFDGQQMPDPAIWGIPGMIWLALNPPLPTRKDPPKELPKEPPNA